MTKSLSGVEQFFVEKKIRALGTDIFLKIVCKRTEREKAEQSLLKAQEIYFKYQKQLSRFDQNSELSKINSFLGEKQKASKEILYLAEQALFFYGQSEGMFDPRILDNLEKIGYDKDFPGIFEGNDLRIEELKVVEGKLEDDLKIFLRKGKREGSVLFKKRMDFTGIAKGYITDMVCEFLEREGWEDFMVDSGGDLSFRGANEKGMQWLAEVEGVSAEKILISSKGNSIATSGVSRRKWRKGNSRVHHLANPKDPQNFSFETRSVTVIREKCTEADAWAKIIFLLGKEKGLELANKKGLACLILVYNGTAIVSQPMKDFLLISNQS